MRQIKAITQAAENRIFFFDAVSQTKNADIDKYKYFGYGIGFDRHGFFSHPNNLWSRYEFI